MKVDLYSDTVLITGISGFTGLHLKQFLEKQGYKVYGLKSDIREKEEIIHELGKIKPNYIIHLAGISFAEEQNTSLIYSVNVEGTLNILDACLYLGLLPKKIILASSASVYGYQNINILHENLCPSPNSHYANSKHVMENMSKNYFDKLNILITRPFNYTGIGHDIKFVIPKIVDAYRNQKKEISLGNINVEREFNDVRDICNIYYKLMLTEAKSIIVNVCSGRAVSLDSVIEYMDKLSSYNIKINVMKGLIRSNDIKTLSGSPDRLSSLIDLNFNYTINDTLSWMYNT